MRPIRTTESNFTYIGTRDDMGDLPGHRDTVEHVFYSVYEFSDEDRALIADGAQVQLGVFTLPIPPISMGVVKLEPSSAGGEHGRDHRCMACDTLYVETRAADLEMKCGWCGEPLVAQ